MKICTTIASLLAFSATVGWSIPQVELTSLRQDAHEGKTFVHVQISQLADLELTEPAQAYAVFYSGEKVTWIVNLNKVTPQTDSLGVTTWVSESLLEDCDEAEIVVCPIVEFPDLGKLIWDKRFRPQHHPSFSPHTEQRIRGNSQYQQQCEASDASVGIKSRELCRAGTKRSIQINGSASC